MHIVCSCLLQVFIHLYSMCIVSVCVSLSLGVCGFLFVIVIIFWFGFSSLLKWLGWLAIVVRVWIHGFLVCVFICAFLMYTYRPSCAVFISIFFLCLFSVCFSNSLFSYTLWEISSSRDVSMLSKLLCALLSI